MATQRKRPYAWVVSWENPYLLIMQLILEVTHLSYINFCTFDQKLSHFWKRERRTFSGTEKAMERFLSVLDCSSCAYNCGQHVQRT
jgi:hypothetical protein